MSTIGIIQPNYLPWRGYFDFIREVDVFVFLDDVQYTTRDWRNRNRIKDSIGATRWLSVPVSGGRNQLIKDVLIDNSQAWANKHLQAIRQSYADTPYFDYYIPKLEEILTGMEYQLLTSLNRALTSKICEWLGIDTNLINAQELDVTGTKDDRLLSIVKKLEGSRYLSGPAAKDYMRPEIWSDAGIELAYKDYSGYPTYPQISEPFEPSVTVLDLLFAVGPEAPEYIWGRFREQQG